MKIITTTVIRHSVIGEQASGHLLEIDWDAQTITHSLPVPDPKFPSSNTNPRGGLRGGRGAKVYQNRYFIANYDTVFVYDADWRPLEEISHPLATDIHEIDIDEQGVWLSCSRYDLVLKLSYAGEKLEHWHISDSPELMRRLGIHCEPLDLSHDYRRHLPPGLDHTHLNCVQIGPDKSVIVNLGQVHPQGPAQRLGRRLFPAPGYHAHALSATRRRMYNLLHGSRSHVVALDRDRPGTAKILSQYPALRPNHNGQLLDNTRTMLASEDGGLVISDIETGQRQLIPVPGTWVRGLLKLDEHRVLVGIQPCAIVEVDINSARVTRQMKLSVNPNESVHGLTLIP